MMNNALYPDAIETNRQGRFAMSQAGGLIGWILLGAFLIFIGVGIIAIDLTDISFSDIVASVLFLWVGYKLGGVILVDIVLGSVSKVEGKGEKNLSSSGKSIKRSYWVGEQRLDVPSSILFGKLNNHERVRAYYLPRSKSLVNLEW